MACSNSFQLSSYRGQHREKQRKANEKIVVLSLSYTFVCFSLVAHVFWRICVREGFPKIPSKHPLNPPKSFPCTNFLCFDPCNCFEGPGRCGKTLGDLLEKTALMSCVIVPRYDQNTKHLAEKQRLLKYERSGFT